MGYWPALIVLNIPIFLGLWRLVFKDWDDFVHCLHYILLPDFISVLRGGDLFDDRWSEIKVWAWLALCGLVLFAGHMWLSDQTPWPGWVRFLFGLLGARTQ